MLTMLASAYAWDLAGLIDPDWKKNWNKIRAVPSEVPKSAE